MEKPHIIDRNGRGQNWEWLAATFGEIRLERAETAGGQEGAYRIVRLEAVEGPSALTARVIDESGRPLCGITVARHWPDAPELPYLPAPSSLWHMQGILGTTGSGGETDFVTGVGDEYTPPETGVSAIWVADPGGPSDLVGGLGMVSGTQHLHLNVVFQHKQSAPPHPDPGPPPPPPDPPTDDQWDTVFAKLDQLIGLLEERLRQ